MADAHDSAVLTDGGITSDQEVVEDYEKHKHDGSGVRSMVLNMGPQHPSTHGVLRLLLELDGETILKAAPDIGFLHTGIEKEFEAKTYQQGVTLTDRIDYLARSRTTWFTAWRSRSCCRSGNSAAGAVDCASC